MLICVVDSRKRPRLRVPTLASQNRAKGTRRPAASKCAKSAAVPLHNNTHHHHTHTNKIINSFKLQKLHDSLRHSKSRLHYFWSVYDSNDRKKHRFILLARSILRKFQCCPRERLEVSKRWNAVCWPINNRFPLSFICTTTVAALISLLQICHGATFSC